MITGLLGGSGFLGRNLYEYIRRVEPDESIKIGSRRTGVDVRNYEQVKNFVQDCDLVCNLSAQTHVDFSLHKDREDQVNFLRTNAEGTLNVIHACHKYRVKMIHISTSECYGQNMNPGIPMTEAHPLLPQAGIYATSKAFADLTCRMTSLTTDADIVVLRPFNYWGPGQSIEKLIPRMINQGLNNEPLTVYGLGTQSRDYVHVEDVARAVWLAKDLSGGQIYNIGTGKAIKIIEIAKMLSDILKVDISYVESRPAEVEELICDYTKFHIATERKWNPTKFITEESLKELITWQKVNGTISQPVL